MDMGTIETTYDLSKDLTTVKATGKMAENDFREWRMSYYSGDPTKLILWDISETDLSGIPSESVATHARLIKENLSDGRRKGGKTAVVAGDNVLAMGMSKMREVYGELEDTPIPIKTFSRMKEALAWLGIEDL